MQSPYQNYGWSIGGLPSAKRAAVHISSIIVIWEIGGGSKQLIAAPPCPPLAAWNKALQIGFSARV